jgi:hypothetical protein
VTLAEFLAPIRGSTNKKKVLATLFYFETFEERQSVRAEEIKKALQTARVPNARTVNVRDVLGKAAHLVHSPGSDGRRRVWQLTAAGRAEVSAMGLPLPKRDVEKDASSLEELVRKLDDPDVKGFVSEALLCLRVGALRAAVVFLWSGTMRTLHSRAYAAGLPQLNDAIKKHDPKAREIRKPEDFGYIRDAVALLACQELGFFDKGQHIFLKQGLDLRNQCGHPSKYKAGEKKVSSFIEDVLGIVFSPN